MRKTTLRLSMLALGVMMFSSNVFAATENTDANIEIVANVSITENVPLEFGQVLNGTAGSNTVTVGTNDGRTIAGAGDAALVVGTAPTAAEYTVTSATGATIDMEVDTATLVSPHATIALDANFVCRANAGADQACDTGDGATFISTGSDTIEVGGDATITNPSVAGVHTGNFDFIANYQ
ncbi:MAG: DUF4402 domain-containing protein [Alphaproteobacteria bacterium]|nr:DUF4402 domain-containing protein [Alphaproteobacteria bacterium]MBN2780088.1 DUF4402 domain-containing protein [Alphaproteobacteria bacterium]